MNLIAVVDKNWGIGYRGELLVNLPQDMAYFKQKTLGKIVIMGKKTLQTLPKQKPLIGRMNIVLTSSNIGLDDGFFCFNTIDTLSKQLQKYDDDTIFVIGGESVYNILIPYCDTAFITKINNSYIADRHLLNFDRMNDWILIDSLPFNDSGISCSFNKYVKKKSYV